MIGSLGGAIIDFEGNRNYPGSGGAVGGLSFPGGNWAYFGGAGAMYNRFTPNNSSLNSIYAPNIQPESIEPVYGGPGPCDTEGHCPHGDDGPILIGGGGPVINTGGGPIYSNPIVNNPCAGAGVASCATTDIPIEAPVNQSALNDLLASLLTTGSRTSTASLPALFSFNQGGTNGAGLDMKKIVIVLVLIVGAYFLYKKYGDKLAG